MLQSLAAELSELREKDLFRIIRPIESATGPRVRMEGRDVLLFCSNNYLGLANDPLLKQAAQDAMAEEGWGSGASRLVCGTMPSHLALEEAIAAFKRKEAVLTFATGYMANLGVLSTLAGRKDCIVLDRLCHASLVDGAKLSGAKLQVYPHCDVEDLQVILEKGRGRFRRTLIVTESVFSMDGDLAPLSTLADLARRYQAQLVVDEAHGTGVFGDGGRGLAEQDGVEDQIDVTVGTLSKAVGSLGGFVTGSRSLIDYLKNRSKPFIYATAVPPAVAAASRAGILAIERQPQRRKQLWDRVRQLAQGLHRLGWTELGTSPIFPIRVGEASRALAMSRFLFERNIFVQAIRPPTVPQGTSRLRVTVTSEHTAQDVDQLLAALSDAKRHFQL